MTVVHPVAGKAPSRQATFHEIRLAVACWLRYARQCPVVAFERGGFGWGWDRPDIFAVNAKRQTYDVEIKCSLSDFRADAKKVKFNPGFGAHRGRPTWFYYAARTELAEKIIPLLPEGAGLLSIGAPTPRGQDAVTMLRPARRHDGAKPSLKAISSWVKDQSGTLCSLAKVIANLEERVHELQLWTEKKVFDTPQEKR